MTIPPEIARSVQERQVHYVTDEMARFGQQLTSLPLEKLQSLSGPSASNLENG